MRPVPYPCHSRLTSRLKQAGSSLVEFSAAAVPILLIGLGGIELAQWFYVKQAISLALLEGARAGITRHANPDAIAAAFEHALLPLYRPTAQRSAQQQMRLKFAERSARIALPPWQIEVIEPSAHAFRDFADRQLPIGRQTGLAAINNDYQAEQDRHYRAQGWPDGAGPHSGMSIYQANTLVLQLVYLHEPLLPGVRGLMRMLSANTNSYSSQAMARGGYLPIVQKITLTMQSHPLDWPALADRKVVKHAASPATSASIQPCRGIWCIGAAAMPPYPPPAAGPGTAPDPNNPRVDDGAFDRETPEGPPAPRLPDETAGTDPGVAPDDPACGVSLCCLAG